MNPDLKNLPPPPTGQTGISPDQFSHLPPPPKGQQGFTLEQISKDNFSTETFKNPLESALTTISNIPSSAINFIKGTANLLNPLNTAKTLAQIPQEFSGLIKESGGIVPALIKTAKELPHTFYEALVPQATKQIIAGDTIGAQKTLEQDPVGQILPYILLARGVAEKVGKGPQFDEAISKLSSPVTQTSPGSISLARLGIKTAQGIGNIGAQILGAETGAGASSIKSALGGSPEFQAALRGHITPEETVTKIEDAFQKLKDNRAVEYSARLEGIKVNKTNLDTSPIHQELVKQLNNFRIGLEDESGNLDFSNSAIRFDKSAQTDVQNIYDTMKKFGTTAGDRTPIGIDSLKRALGDLYTPSSNVRAFIQAMKSVTRDVLNKNVPDYEKMTKGYNTASNLIDEIKSATSAGKGANADTVFTKITSALKSDKEFRLQMLNELENGSGQKLIDTIAGHNLAKWVPTSFIGRGIDVYAAYEILNRIFTPSMIPALLTTSPRVIGEFLNAIGVSGKYFASILKAIEIVNKSPEKLQGINVPINVYKK